MLKIEQVVVIDCKENEGHLVNIVKGFSEHNVLLSVISIMITWIYNNSVIARSIGNIWVLVRDIEIRGPSFPC